MGPGQMAQQLNELAALPEDRSSPTHTIKNKINLKKFNGGAR